MNMDEHLIKAFVDSQELLVCVNTVTLEVDIRKYRGKYYPESEKSQNLFAFIEKLIKDDDIYEDDLWQFALLRDRAQAREYYLSPEGNSFIVYRRRINGETSWVRINILFPDDYSEANPYLMVHSSRMNKGEAAFLEAFTVQSVHLIQVIKMNLTDDIYEVIKEPNNEAAFHQGVKSLSEFLDRVMPREGLIDPEDIIHFEQVISVKHLKKHFSEGNESFTWYHRRRMGAQFRWARFHCLKGYNYSEENQLVFAYVSDVHNDVLRILDENAIVNFTRHYHDDQNPTDVYNRNMQNALFYLSRSFLDCYIVDLKRDLYLKYKIRSGTYTKDIDYIGTYSKQADEYIKEMLTGKDAEEMRLYCTPEKIRKVMMDKTAYDYDFAGPDGRRLRTTMIKLESENGVPTKVICTTVVSPDNDFLHIRTFGNFEVRYPNGELFYFGRAQSKQLFAYLVDRNGFPASSADIVEDVLEKPDSDKAAVKYVSTMISRLIKELENAGYGHLIIKDRRSV